MSINRKSRYCLKVPYGENNHATISKIDNFSLNGKNEFTLYFEYYNSASEHGQILRSGDDFSISINHNTINVVAKDLVAFSYDMGKYLLSDSFNEIAITYNKEKVALYINTVCFYSVDCTNSGDILTDEFVIGSLFEGYIGGVYIFNKAFEDEEVRLIADHFEDKECVELGFSFDKASPQDKGKNSLIFRPVGLACQVNFASALKVGDGGCVFPLSVPVMQKDATILAHIYVDYITKEQVVYSYGDDASNFTLGVIKENDVQLFLEVDNVKTIINGKIQLYQWCQIAVVIADKVAKVYCDGELLEEVSLDISLDMKNFAVGNVIRAGKVVGNNYNGYIDYVAVFNSALSQEEVSKYLTFYPSFLSKDIVALYDFSLSIKDDVSQSSLATIGEVGIAITENTSTNDSEVDVKLDVSQEEIEMSDYDRWACKKVLDGISEYLSFVATGNEAGEIEYSDKLLYYIKDNYLEDSSVQVYLASYNKKNSDNLSAMYKFVFLGTSISLVGAFGYRLTNWYRAFRVFQIYVNRYWAYVVSGLAIALITKLVITALSKYSDDQPAKKVDPKSSFEGAILSMNFNSGNENGAIPTKLSPAELNLSPEYSSCRTNQGRVLCLDDDKNLQCTGVVELSIENSDAIKLTLDCYLNEKTIYSTVVEINEPTEGENTFDFEIKKSALPYFSESMKDITFSWMMKKKDDLSSIKSIGNIVLSVSKVKKMPVAPFDNKTNLVDFETLKLAKLVSIEDEEARTTQSIAEYIDACGLLVGSAQTENYFTKIENSEVTIELQKAVNIFKGTDQISVSSLDTAAISMALNGCLGIKTCIVAVGNPLDDEFQLSDAPVKLTVETRNIKYLCSEVIIEKPEFEKHYSLAVISEGESVENDKIYMYDPYITVIEKDAEYPLVGIPFSDNVSYYSYAFNEKLYKECLIKEHDVGDITEIIDVMLIAGATQLTNNDLKISGLTNDPYDRPKFDKKLRDVMVCSTTTNRAHSIAWAKISDIAKAIFSGVIDDATKIQEFTNFKSALFIDKGLSGDAYQYNERVLTGLQAKISDAVTVNKANDIANMMSRFQNCIPNLRIGNSAWNTIVASSFDPEEWVLTNGVGVVIQSHNGTETGTYPFKNAYILTSANDQARCYNFRNLLYSENATACVKSSSTDLLCSSSNINDVPAGETSATSIAQKVYVLCDTNWILIS